MPYVKKLSHGEYWKQDMELSNTDMMDGNVGNTPILHIRFHEVAEGHGYSVDHLLDQISSTIKAMDGDNPWGVYDNQFRQGYRIGDFLATVSFLKNYAEYDEPNTFKDILIKLHGEDVWQPFIRGMADSMSNGAGMRSGNTTPRSAEIRKPLVKIAILKKESHTNRMTPSFI